MVPCATAGGGQHPELRLCAITQGTDRGAAGNGALSTSSSAEG